MSDDTIVKVAFIIAGSATIIVCFIAWLVAALVEERMHGDYDAMMSRIGKSSSESDK